MKPPATAEQICIFAPAKINLFLHVGGRRADGYHELQSLVAFADVGDELALTWHSELSLSVRGRFAGGLSAGDGNLVMQAARLLAQTCRSPVGAAIVLEKHLPVASGIGGGSADAAAVLRGLAQLWQLPIENHELVEIAMRLGSDVPMCIASTAAWVEGRGERVAPLPALPDFALLLVNPLVQVPTRDVFSKLTMRSGTELKAPTGTFASAGALVRFLGKTSNDLEGPAIGIAPAVGDVLKELKQIPGALLARMSGSGATCFAILETFEQAASAAQVLRVTHPDWWIVPARSAAPGLFPRANYLTENGTYVGPL